jgi:hypothetical protein
LFCLPVPGHNFAFFQRDGEFSFAHGERVLAEDLIAPAMQASVLPVLVAASF